MKSIHFRLVLAVSLGAIWIATVPSRANAQKTLYTANFSGGGVFKVTSGGAVNLFAQIPSGDGHTEMMTVDPGGNLFITTDNGSIIKVAPDATVSTFVSGYSLLTGVTSDAQGDIYAGQVGTGKVLKFTPGGSESDYATVGGIPEGLVFDTRGNLFVSDFSNGQIDKINPARTPTIFASGLSEPTGLTIDGLGNLYVSSFNLNSISKISTGGSVSDYSTRGLQNPFQSAFDDNGSLFVADDGNHRLSEIAPGGGAATSFATDQMINPTAIVFVGAESTVPEPTVYQMTAILALGGLGLLRRRRSQSSK